MFRTFATALFVTVVLTVCHVAQPATAQEVASKSKPITIYSHGVRLAGDLWTPPGVQAGEKRPAILMIHGWGGNKEELNLYAPHFSKLGYYILTFDYRGWGKSDGDLLPVAELPKDRGAEFQVKVREVREVVNPINQYEDISAALSYLKGEPGVDATRLAVWGTSLGGGLAVKTAIKHPEIKVVIDQIGVVNMQDWYARLPKTSPLHADNIEVLRSAIARGDAPSVPGPDAKWGKLRGVADHPALHRHTPMENVESLRAATLIIDAAEEELFDTAQNGRLLYERIKGQTTASYESVPGTHYDLYKRPAVEKVVGLQFQWLIKHLPVK